MQDRNNHAGKARTALASVGPRAFDVACGVRVTLRGKLKSKFGRAVIDHYL